MTRLTTTTALITLMATPTVADVTAHDVWNGFKTFNLATGLDVAATQTKIGSTTNFSDLSFSGNFPFEMGSISISTTGFGLIENRNGTVDIKLPENMPIAVALSLPDDLFVTANLDLETNGYSAQASGDPDNYTVLYNIEKSTVRFVDISLPDTTAFGIEMTVAMQEMTGKTTYKIGKMLSISQISTGGEMELDGNFSVKNSDGVDETFTFSMATGGMESDSNLVLPATGIDLLNISDQLRDGMSIQTTSKLDSIATRNRVASSGETSVDQKTFAESLSSSISLARNGLKYNSIYTNYGIDYTIQRLPFPIRLNFAKAGGSVKLPLLKSDAEKDVSYALTLEGMTMGKDIWDAFDPTGALLRDPATLNLDMSGKGHLLMDLLKFTALKAAIDEGEKIATPTSLTINTLKFDAIGATVNGSGTFTFDNDDYETFNGIPAPSGTATMHFSGVNAVIDRLIDIGLLDSEKALGMRMGLGMFTVLGDGKDTLVSEIEITPNGHISANGKRLK